MRIVWLALGLLLPLAIPQSGHAQHPHLHHSQHDHVQRGKPDDDESAPLNEDERFAAPPRTGLQEGAASGVSINGPTIEIPAMSLKLPTIRFPGVSQFRSPPKMLIDQAVAPLIREIRQEFTFPAQDESAPLPPAPGPGNGDDEAAPLRPKMPPPQQKEFEQYQQKQVRCDCPGCTRQRESYDQLAQRNQQLETRIDKLQNSIEALVAAMQSTSANWAPAANGGPPPVGNHGQPPSFPAAEREFPVRQSAYVHSKEPATLSAQPMRRVHPPVLERLPYVE